MGWNIVGRGWMIGTALVSALTAFAAAQGDQRWIASYDGPAGYYDVPRCTAVDSKGYVYVSGESATTRPPTLYDPVQMDMVTLKYSPCGELVWERRYGSDRAFSEAASAVVVDDEGHVFVTGSSAEPHSLREDIVTLKYDSTGQLIWARHGCEGSQGFGSGSRIVLDGEGGVVVTGSSYFLTGATKSQDIVTIRYDRHGNTLWQRTYASAENGQDWSWALTQDGEGGFVVTGQSAATPPWIGAKNHDVLTIRYDGQGRLLWVQRYDGLQSGEDAGYAVQAGRSGNIYVTGSTQSEQPSWYGNDSITLAYSREGALLWTSRFDGPGGSLDLTHHMVLDEQENIFIGGLTMSPAGYPDTDFLVIKLDRQGRRQWARSFPSQVGYKNSGSVDGLVLAPKGGILVAGYEASHSWRSLRLSSQEGAVLWEYRLDSPALLLSSLTGGIALTREGALVLSGTGFPQGWPDYEFITLRIHPD